MSAASSSIFGPPGDPFAIDTFVTFETCVTAEDIVIDMSNGAPRSIADPTDRCAHLGEMRNRNRRDHRASACIERAIKTRRMRALRDPAATDREPDDLGAAADV